MDCPFCNILTKNKKRIIKENKYTFLVLSDPRLMPGHLLIIPKRHVEKIGELQKEEKEELFAEIIRTQEKILAEVSSGCDISQHFRPFIKQNKLKVNHLHIHIRPRELEDELYERVQKFEKDVFTKLSEKEFQEYKKIFS